MLEGIKIYNIMRARYIIEYIIYKLALNCIDFFKSTIIYVSCIVNILNNKIFVCTKRYVLNNVIIRECNWFYRGEGAVFVALLGKCHGCCCHREQHNQ